MAKKFSPELPKMKSKIESSLSNSVELDEITATEPRFYV